MTYRADADDRIAFAHLRRHATDNVVSNPGDFDGGVLPAEYIVHASRGWRVGLSINR